MKSHAKTAKRQGRKANYDNGFARRPAGRALDGSS